MNTLDLKPFFIRLQPFTPYTVSGVLALHKFHSRHVMNETRQTLIRFIKAHKLPPWGDFTIDGNFGWFGFRFLAPYGSITKDLQYKHSTYVFQLYEDFPELRVKLIYFMQRFIPQEDIHPFISAMTVWEPPQPQKICIPLSARQQKAV